MAKVESRVCVVERDGRGGRETGVVANALSLLGLRFFLVALIFTLVSMTAFI